MSSQNEDGFTVVGGNKSRNKRGRGQYRGSSYRQGNGEVPNKYDQETTLPSAPLSMEEQEKTTKASFIPVKTTNFTYYPPPHYNPMHSSTPYNPNHGVPPYGHSQNSMYQQQQQQQQQQPRKPLTVVRKPLVPVNPAAGEEVEITTNNTEFTTTASVKPKENDHANLTKTGGIAQYEENESDEEEEEEDDDDVTQKKSLIYSKDELFKYLDHFKMPPKELENFDSFFDHRDRNTKDHKNGQPKGKSVKTSDEGDKIKQDVLLILSKLTPENFDMILEQLLQIRIPNEDVFQKVIYAIYDMAVLSPHYSFLFARLCADYSEKLGKEKDTETSKFKRILLGKCQERFQQKNALEFDEQVSPEEREKMEFKQRKHNIGNITFIGELYKKKMLNERIMHEVIKILLDFQSKNPSQHSSKHEDLELLAHLFTTIGKQLDHEKSKKFMDFYFLKMKAITTNKNYPSRIRYLILDVVELRENKWVPQFE